MRKTRGISVVIGLALLLGGGRAPVFGQDSELTCDLTACLNYALRHHPQILAADAAEVAETAAVLLRRTQFRPTLDLGANLVEVSGEPTSYFAVSGVIEPEIVQRRILYQEYYSASVELTIPLFKEGVFFGIGAPSVKAAEADREKEATQVGILKEAVVSAVSESYVLALKAGEMLPLADAMVRINKRRYEMTQAQARQQILSEEDVKMAELAWRSSQQAADQARQAWTDALARLSRDVGAGPGMTVRVNGEPPPHGSLSSEEALIEAAWLRNPESNRQQASIDSAQAAVRVSRSRQMPTLDFVNNYVYADDFKAPGSNFMAALLRLQVPIFDFGQYASDVRLSEAKVRTEEKMLVAVRAGIAQSVTQAYSKIRETESGLKVADLEVQQAEIQLKQAQAKVRQQVLSPFVALAAEQSLVEKKKTRSEMEFDRQLGYIELRHAVGGPLER